MNSTAILSLISDLYQQIAALQDENARLRAAPDADISGGGASEPGGYQQ